MRAAKRMAAGMATAAPRIGDTKVPMSLLEPGKFINYQRIEDNLETVRGRSVLHHPIWFLTIDFSKAAATTDAFWEDPIWTSWWPAWPGHHSWC